jgi:hypothetical protein
MSLLFPFQAVFKDLLKMFFATQQIVGRHTPGNKSECQRDIPPKQSDEACSFVVS